MPLTSPPDRFPVPFANNADPATIRPVPIPSQIGIQDGAASMTTGFVVDNGTPIAAGGVPPFEQDFNGLLLQITKNIQWTNAGALFTFDSDFATRTGGYPIGAMLSSNPFGTYWFNTLANNQNDPDAGGTGWLPFDPTAMPTTGDWKSRPTSEAIPSWIAANGLTIGSAASGATGLASATAFNLYKWTWLNFSQSQCPVTGGRGANPAADFAANKPIQLLDLKGTGFMGMDTMGGASSTRLAGVPFTLGNATTPGSICGENLHSLVLAENGPHNHTLTDPGHNHGIATATGLQPGGATLGVANGTRSIFSSTDVTNISLASSGSGTGHNTVQRSIIGTIYLKL